MFRCRSEQGDWSPTGLSLDDQALLSFKNALHTAIDYGSLDVVRTLLENGVDPNAGGHTWTALDQQHQRLSAGTPVFGRRRSNVVSDVAQWKIDEDSGGYDDPCRAVSKNHTCIGIYFAFFRFCSVATFGRPRRPCTSVSPSNSFCFPPSPVNPLRPVSYPPRTLVFVTCKIVRNREDNTRVSTDTFEYIKI